MRYVVALWAAALVQAGRHHGMPFTNSMFVGACFAASAVLLVAWIAEDRE